MTDAERITALEIEIADLKRHVAPPATKKPAPPIEEGVCIFYPTMNAAVELPTAEQLLTLGRLVVARHPRLGPDTAGRWGDHNEAEWTRGFASAFAWLGTRGRSAEMNHKIAVSFWISVAEEWARAAQCSTTIPGNAFLCAVLAWGDIPYIQADNVGNSWTFSLSTHGGGKMPTAASWRRVLSTGNIMPPSVGRFKDISPRRRGYDFTLIKKPRAGY